MTKNEKDTGDWGEDILKKSTATQLNTAIKALCLSSGSVFAQTEINKILIEKIEKLEKEVAKKKSLTQFV